MEKYCILVSQILKYEDIYFYQEPAEKTYSPEIQDMIEETWENLTKNKESKYLYDGNVYSLMAVSSHENKVICNVRNTTYKAYIGTNVHNIDKIPDKKDLANAIASCVVSITSDGYILIGRRSGKLAEGGNEWHVVGGTMEGVVVNGELKPENPYDLITKELHEEINVSKDEIDVLYCTGIGISTHNHKPEFLFVCKLKLSKDQLISKVKNVSGAEIEEHTEFKYIKATQLKRFLKTNTVAPICECAMELYLKNKKGIS